MSNPPRLKTTLIDKIYGMQSLIHRVCIVVMAIMAHLNMIGQVVFQANNTSGCTPMGVVISVTSPAAPSITNYLWQITTPTGSVLTASSSQYVAIFSQPGHYDVSLTINGNQNTTINDYISVHALPTANFTVNDPSGCFPLCVSFDDVSVIGEGNIVEWSWDFGDGNSSTSQNPQYCYTQPGNFTPVFSIEDEFGCFSDITMPGMIQVVNSFPNAVFTSSSQLDCNPPVNISFSNSSTGVSALESNWDFGDGQSEPQGGTGSISHTFNQTGDFEICMAVSDQIGCTDTVCHQLTIFDTADAEFTISGQTVCEGEVVTFTSTTIPAPTSLQWDFNGDGIVDSNNAIASYSFTDPGNFSPSLTVNYSTGCNDVETGNFDITVIEGYDVLFSADVLQSCSFPFSVHFDNQSTGQGPADYEWFVNGVSVSTTTDLDYTFNSYGEYDIRLTATNSNGCTTEYLINDYILVQQPQVEFDNGSSVCTDQNVPIFNVEVISVDPVAFYFWDFNSDGQTDAEGLAPLFMYDAPGFYSITLTIETVTGCTATYTNTQDINVLVQVDAAFTSSADTTCAGEPVEFCVANQPGNTYSWNFYDGSGWVIMPLSESCIIHDYADTGWYDLTLTVFNGACNVLQTFENFIYVQPPVALFEYQVICGDLIANFADISIGADSIVWDFGDGSALLSDDSAPTHQYTASGTYTVILTAYADGSDCPDVTSAEITVSEPDPSMFFTPDAGCPPLVSQFSCSFYYPHWDVTVSNGDHIVVNWDEQDGEWDIEHTHEGVTDYLNSPNEDHFDWPLVTLNEGGYYDVGVIVTDANGCSVNTIYDDAIHVSANPDFAAFNTTTIDLCNDVNIGFEPVLEDLVTWQWVFSDGSVSTSENPIHSYNPPYNYNSPLSATLTATDSLGCTSSVTQQIDIILPPVVNFVAASDPSCIGDAVQFINYSVGPVGTTYFWDFGDPLSAENSSNIEEPNHTFSSNGTYEVCLSADNQAGCVITYCNVDAVHIVNPAVDFSYSSTINNCLYGVQFTNTTPGTVVSAEWNFGDNQGGYGNMAFHTYPIGVYDVTLTVINNYGCIDSLVVPDILNYGNQVGPFTQALDSADCAPFDIDLTAFNPADTYFEYFWDFNDGSGDPSGNTLTNHTYLEPGSYCPSVIMTDPNGCPMLISCSDTIEVDEFVMNYIIPSHICFGDTLNLTITNGETYQWEDMSHITSGVNYGEFMLHPIDDTQFILNGTYSDCERQDTINLVVNDLPVVTLSLPASLCYGDQQLLLDTGLPNDPPGTYSVNGTTTTFFDPLMTPAMIYPVNYTYTDTFQCTNSATASIHLHALPVVNFPPMPDVCEDADTVLLNLAMPAGGVYTMGSDTITFIDPSIGYGNNPLNYVYTDINGCINSDSSMLRINPIPELQIEFTDECINEGLVINNLSVIAEGAIISNLWNLGVAGTDTNAQPQPIYFPATGSYAFQLVAESNGGCVSVLDSTVIIHDAPQPSFTPEVACQHTQQVFYDHSTIGTDSIITWIWGVEGLQISSPDSLQYAFTGWGEIPVQLTAISDFGCRDSITTNVTVRPAPIVNLTVENGCYGLESFFHADTSIPIGGVISEAWDFGDGNPIEYGADVDNEYGATGQYFIQFTAESNLGCTTIVEDSLIIYSVPEPDFAIDPDHLCANSAFQIIDLSSVAPPSELAIWSWAVESLAFSSIQNPEFTIVQPGSYDITLSVTSNHGCSGDTTISNGVTVYPAPNAGFEVEEEITLFNPDANIVDISSDDVTTWYYEFGDGAAETFEDGLHTYTALGNYEITQMVWNTFGCSDTTTRFIEVSPRMIIHIPNAFTPDANGHNEIFIPVLHGFDITYYHLNIFDRWGILVFSTDSPDEGWDGYFNGEVSPDGAYSWVMDIKNGDDVSIHRKFGSVILLK